MNFSNFSVNRPVFVTMATMIIMVLGSISLSRLPIDLMPEITYPTLSVVTKYPGAGPEEVEKLISRKIEQALSAVPGAESVSSNSSEGSSSVRISFSWGTKLDEAANDIRDRLDRIVSSLPVGASRPTLRKFDLAQFPVLILGATSDLDPIETQLLVENQLRYRIEKQNGVAALDIWGGASQEVQVLMNADKLRSLEIEVKEVINALKKQNINLPIGSLRQGNYDLIVRAAGEFSRIEDIRSTLVAVRDRSPIFLGEIARITLNKTQNTRIIRINGEPGIRIAVRKQSGANTVNVAKSVLAELERVTKDLPQLKVIPLIDTSRFIENAIKNVARSAAYGGLFAILILLLFLRNARSTAIIATAIPISIIATFIPVQTSGMTLNLMSLGGLAIGVGLIVDNAIVVLENIYRHRQSGMDAKESAIRGSKEVTPAIIASTFTTMVIFLPLLFVRGISGIMFSQLAFVIGFALLCSLIVSLSVIPMFAAKALRKTKQPENTRSWLQESYAELLLSALNAPKKTLVLVLVLFSSSLALYPLIGKEFMPSADQNEVRVSVEMDPGTHLEALKEKFNLVESLVKDGVPEAENIITSMGGGSWRSRGSHQGNMQVALVPADQRTRTSDQIASSLGNKLTGIPGVKIRSRAGRGLFIFRIGQGSGERVQIEIRGYDLDAASQLSREIQSRIKEITGVGYVRASRGEKSPERLVEIDRGRAADLGVSISDIAETLQTFLAGVSGGTFRDSGNEYNIMLKVEDSHPLTLDRLLNQNLLNSERQPISLKNVAKPVSARAPLEISRLNQERVTTISVSVSGRDINLVIDDIRGAIANLPIPEDFNVVFTGDYEAQQEAFRELLFALILSVILIYMVLACLYESLRDPLVVLFSVPVAAIGVLVMLFLTKDTFNIQSWIGCIMLGGIVVNNAILLVDQINQEFREGGKNIQEAILLAGRYRLRPILMTAMTTVLAMLPLAIGLGEGSEAQSSMAKVVIGGLASSTFITLFLIPVVYLLAEQWFPRSVKQPSDANKEKSDPVSVS
jgi:HAE1 family hydrophobic/amphiphilic exporter-1